MKFNDWWDTRIDKHEKFFNTPTGSLYANFAYSEVLALFEAFEKEQESVKGDNMIVMDHKEFDRIVKAASDKAVQEALTSRKRKIRLAIEMLEYGLDIGSVTCLLKKALEDE